MTTAENALGQKKYRKFFLPKIEDPETNVLGLLIGPRGTTLRKIQDLTGTYIQIRGKGSQKTRRQLNGPQQGDEEELHALIQADTEEAVNRAVKVIDRLLFNPKIQQQFRLQQLKNLARINGTEREDSALFSGSASGDGMGGAFDGMGGGTSASCRFCGSHLHRSENCPKRKDNEEEVDFVRYILEDKIGADSDSNGSSSTSGRTATSAETMKEFYRSLAEVSGVRAPDSSAMKIFQSMGLTGDNASAESNAQSSSDARAQDLQTLQRQLDREENAEYGAAEDERGDAEKKEEEEEYAVDIFDDYWGPTTEEVLADIMSKLDSAPPSDPAEAFTF